MEPLNYRVKLDLFEGPMELLLFLIRRNEIDIYDIPMSELTNQFIEYVDLMKNVSLEVSGDFIDMAATLMRIKSRMLLPLAGNEDDDEAEPDPRNELVRNLLEYEKYSMISRQMRIFEEKQSRIAYGGAIVETGKGRSASSDPPVNLKTSILLKLFEEVMEKKRKKPALVVGDVRITIKEKMVLIRNILSDSPRFSFSRFFMMYHNRLDIVACFIALLELARLGELSFRQLNPDSDIFIFRKSKKEHNVRVEIGTSR